MIKAMIRKEFRENCKLALAGAAVFGVILKASFNSAQMPLVDRDIEVFSSIFCGIFGALLGWLQIRRENHPDLRAFLMHRPLSPAKIFLGKVTAGLLCYLIGAGLPMVCLTAFVLTPGLVAAPFEWEMTLPPTYIFLGGVASYFMGMLVARQPQSRWPVTCGVLALGAGLLVFVWEFHEFWPGVLLVIASGTIAAVAAWGNFVSNGDSRRGSILADIALPFALMPGAVLVLFMAVALFIALVIRPVEPPYYYAKSYSVLADGTVAVLAPWGAGAGASLTDTNGEPLKDSKTGKSIGADVIDQISAPATAAITLPTSGIGFGYTYRDSARYCEIVFSGPPVTWFYSFKRGRFLGYESHSRKPVGSIGPDGFASNSMGTEAGFLPRNYMEFFQSSMNVADAHAVYHLDYAPKSSSPTVRRVFNAPPDDTIVGVAEIRSNSSAQFTSVTTVNGVPTVAPTRNVMVQAGTTVVTAKSIYVLDKGSNMLWKLPRPADFSGDSSLRVLLTQSPAQCVLMIAPSDVANRKANGKLVTHLEYYNTDSTLAKSVDLPTFLPPEQAVNLESKAIGFLMPRLSGVLHPMQAFVTYGQDLLVAALCAAVAVLLGWRARFGVGAQIGWVVFILLTNAGGLLVFLWLYRWPIRECCPGCGKPRLVDRDRCEHCGASFAPAKKNGTEIFEPLEAGTLTKG